MSKETTHTADGADGLTIFYRRLTADDERARVVVVHGLGEHSGRYQNVFSALGPKGYSFWALDLRGHGQSAGKRGHVKAFDQYLLDVKVVLSKAQADKAAGCKLFLLGHSMGGLIALLMAAQHAEGIDGVVASSPSLGMIVKVPAVKGFLGKVMSAIWPGLTMGNELDSSKLSHDPEVVKAYDTDPLVHGRVSARWFTEFLAAMARANDLAPEIQTPLLMQVAGDDHLVNAPSSRVFFDRLAQPDKTLHFYDSNYHESYNESTAARQQALSDLESWLESRV